MRFSGGKPEEILLMSLKTRYSEKIRLDERHLELSRIQFGSHSDATYLNTGSVGHKPLSVLEAIERGWRHLNTNPTLTTYLESEHIETCRQAAADLFEVNSECLFFADSTTQGLQLLISSFLRYAGDEVVTTSREHKSVNTILRYLEDTRGIKVRRLTVDNDLSSEQLCMSILNVISPDTRLILISEIDCHTGWRPDLTILTESLKLLEKPLLVDGAHAPGNGPCRPGRYPLWVGAGHKWLGGPNGTAFVYAERDLIPRLDPLIYGDGFYQLREEDLYDPRRLECRGTADVVKLMGLKAAVELYAGLDQMLISDYQNYLVSYLKESLLSRLPARMRGPSMGLPEGEGQASMITFYFEPDFLKVKDLRQALWDEHRIWVQPDFLGVNPGAGVRISGHYSLSESDIDRFVEALSGYVVD